MASPKFTRTSKRPGRHAVLCCFFSTRNVFIFAIGTAIFFWMFTTIWMDGWSHGRITSNRCVCASSRFGAVKDSDLHSEQDSLKSYLKDNINKSGSNGRPNFTRKHSALVQPSWPNTRSKVNYASNNGPNTFNKTASTSVQSSEHSQLNDELWSRLISTLKERLKFIRIFSNSSLHNETFQNFLENMFGSAGTNMLLETNNYNNNKTPSNSRMNESQHIKEVPISSHQSATKLSPFVYPRPPITTVSCPALINGNETEIERVKDMMKRETITSMSGELYFTLASNCSNFKSTRGYITSPLTSLGREFPIAFSLLMYKDIEQAERLLRAIYMPQHIYCIHVDKKSSDTIRKGMEAISNCFDNVFVIQNPIDVQWGTFTVLEPELACLKELWAYKRWKYFINLTGQEFPLKTNFELMKILAAYNGANNLEGTIERANLDRWAMVGPPPHGYIATKGSVHVTLSRGYVDFLLHNETALDLLEWVKNTSMPDETYFSTLNHNPQLGVPGSYKGQPETDWTTYPFLTRYKLWVSGIFNKACLGKYVRSVCVFGVGDLPALTSQRHLFANKFHWDFEHYARDCLEEWHYNKSRKQFFDDKDIDVSYYKNLSFVKNHVD